LVFSYDVFSNGGVDGVDGVDGLLEDEVDTFQLYTLLK